ncbi:MAG: hypothetical protein ABIW81_04340 [Terrimesophilobacter sp.]
MSLFSAIAAGAIATGVHASEEHLAPLVMPNWAFPLIGFIVFTFLGVVTWSFRDVANRHSQRTHDTSGEPVHH